MKKNDRNLLGKDQNAFRKKQRSHSAVSGYSTDSKKNVSLAKNKSSMNYHSDAAFPSEDTLPERIKILVAEDNMINQIVIKKMLEKEGFEVDIAENGAHAVEAVQKKQYSFILMDIQMPEMNGYEASESIREMESGTGQRTFIIALTASATQKEREKCLHAGMDEFVTKPIDRKELAQLLKNMAAPQCSV